MTGFARLRRIQDTHVRQFVDYYQSLDVGGQSALADASTLWGTHTFRGSVLGESSAMDDLHKQAAHDADDEHAFAGIDVAAALRSNVAWTNWAVEMTNGKHRDQYWYASVPELRLYRARATMRRSAGEPPPTEWDRLIENYASSVVGAKAPALRKLVGELVAGRFRGRATKGSGGDWTYEGEVRSGRVFLAIDYGGSTPSCGIAFALKRWLECSTFSWVRGGVWRWTRRLGLSHRGERLRLHRDAWRLIDAAAQWPARLRLQ